VCNKFVQNTNENDCCLQVLCEKVLLIIQQKMGIFEGKNKVCGMKLMRMIYLKVVIPVTQPKEHEY